MNIVNPRFEDDLRCGRPVRIDLGCGPRPREGFYAVDHLPLSGVDVVADLNKPLGWLPDDSVEYLYSSHVMEHIQEFLPLMKEIHRVTRAGGTVEILTPHFSNVYALSDPTHIRFFGLYSMNYFVALEDQPALRKVPAFYSDARFRMRSLRIEFYTLSPLDKILGPLFERLFNRSFRLQDLYERRFSRLWHAYQLRYIMEPVKPSSGV